MATPAPPLLAPAPPIITSALGSQLDAQKQTKQQDLCRIELLTKQILVFGIKQVWEVQGTIGVNMGMMTETVALKQKEIEGLQKEIATNQMLEAEYNKRIGEIEAEIQRLSQFDDQLDAEANRLETLEHELRRKKEGRL